MATYVCADCGCVTQSASIVDLVCPDCSSIRMVTEKVVMQVAGEGWRDNFERYDQHISPHRLLVLHRLVNGMSKARRKRLVSDLLRLQIRDGNEDRNPLLFGLAQWIDEEETKRLCTR